MTSHAVRRDATVDRRTTAALAASVALTLMGCAGGSVEELATPWPFPATATSSPTPSVEMHVPHPPARDDTERAPERPAAMSAPTVEGAVATAQYFLTELYPHIYRSGDLREWNELSSPDCTFCAGMRDKTTEMVTAGEHVDAGAVTLSNTSATEQRAGSWYLVSARLEQETSTRLDRAGAALSTTPGGAVDALLAISWDGAWQVDEVDLTPVTH